MLTSRHTTPNRFGKNTTVTKGSALIPLVRDNWEKDRPQECELFPVCRDSVSCEDGHLAAYRAATLIWGKRTRIDVFSPCRSSTVIIRMLLRGSAAPTRVRHSCGT